MAAISEKSAKARGTDLAFHGSLTSDKVVPRDPSHKVSSTLASLIVYHETKDMDLARLNMSPRPWASVLSLGLQVRFVSIEPFFRPSNVLYPFADRPGCGFGLELQVYADCPSSS